MVLLDEAGVTVTATGFSDGYFSPVMNLHIDNSTDKMVYVDCSRFVINGYAASGYLYTEVEAGSEAEAELSIYDASMDLLGTEYIGELELQIIVNDENYDRIATGDIVTIRTSDYDKDWYRTIDGDVIFSEEGLTLKLVSVTRGEYWPSTDYTFVLENTSDRAMDVDFSNMLINGTESYPWFYQTVYPGTMAVGSLSVDDESLADTGSDTLDSLEIMIVVYDNETYEEIIRTEDFIALPVGLG